MHLSFNNLVSSVRFSNFNSLSSQLTKPTNIVAIALAALAIAAISILLVMRKRSKPANNVKKITPEDNLGGKKGDQVGQQTLNKTPDDQIKKPNEAVVIPGGKSTSTSVIASPAKEIKKTEEVVVQEEDDDEDRPLPPLPAEAAFEVAEEFSENKVKSSPPKEDNDPDFLKAIENSLKDEKPVVDDDWDLALALKESTTPIPPPPGTPPKVKVNPKVKKDPVATVESNTPEFEEKLRMAIINAQRIKNFSGIDVEKSEIQNNANGHRFLVLHFTRKTFCNTAIPEFRSDNYGIFKSNEKPIMIGNEGTIVRLTVEQSKRFQLRFNP